MEEKKSFTCRDDLRTLFIAFLTTLIMLAFYHIGTSLCRMKQECAKQQCIVVKSTPCRMERFNRNGFAHKQFQRRHQMEGRDFQEGPHKFHKAAQGKAPVKAAPAPEAAAQK